MTTTKLPRPFFLRAMDAIDTAAACLETTAEYDWLCAWCEIHGLSSSAVGDLLLESGRHRDSLIATRWIQPYQAVPGVQSLEWFANAAAKSRLRRAQVETPVLVGHWSECSDGSTRWSPDSEHATLASAIDRADDIHGDWRAE